MDIENRQTRVKICGITKLEDARFASGAMVDYLGFIFWPGSPRFVTTETAAEIIGWVEGPECVGVFVNQPTEEVNRLAAETGIDLVQLHGDETVEYCRDIEKPVIKSFRIEKGMTKTDVQKLVEPYLDEVKYLLFDTHDEHLQGGTGRVFDWSLIRNLNEQAPVILAGGLNAGNVRYAVQTVQPFAVDVSSSLESEPGIKDFEKIAAFMDAFSSVNENN